MPHTPGPWEAFHVTSAGWSVRRQHEREGYTGKAPICSMAWWQFDIPGIIDNEISGANARLIAASPNYHAAVKDLLDLWPLSGYELEAYMSATFIPAVTEAFAKVVRV